ncbi:MAG TPA: carboxypeptidase regulatory-like domain-containing protein [Planctomycetota bacterium]
MRRLWLLGLCLAAACGDSAPPPASPPAPPRVETPPRFGILTGRVRVDSDDIAPVGGSVRGFEKYCGTGPLDLGIYKVDPSTRGLAGAYVEADGHCEEFRAESVPVLDQKGCLFTPVLLVVPPGPVVFKNSDGMAHNVTIRGLLNPAVGEGFPGGEAISKTFPFEERLAVRCTVHPWMQAGLVVTKRASHALTDAAGRFRIDRVEAGRRRVRVWHLLGEEVTIEIEIPPDGVAEVEIPWKPRPGFRAPFGR